MNNKQQSTQGHTKVIIRLKELFDNEAFRQELKAVQNIKSKKKQSQLLYELAEKYGLEYDIGSPLLDVLMGRNPKKYTLASPYLDMCKIFDEVDQYLNPNFPMDFDIPPSLKPNKRLELNLYPIHIGISPKATKRDVLDFVKKRWGDIRYMLDEYEEKPKIIRRKRKQARNAYIWQNRQTPSEELAEKVNAKFPKEDLTYSDINSIKTYLKKRKSQL